MVCLYTCVYIYIYILIVVMNIQGLEENILNKLGNLKISQWIAFCLV